MNTSIPMFHIGFKDTDLGQVGKEDIKKDLMTNLMLDMLFSDSSILYNELYDSGLIDGSFGAYYAGSNNYGHSLIVGETEEPILVKDKIVKFLSKPIDEILRKEDFYRMKNDEIGNFIMSFDSIEFIGNTGVEMYFSKFPLFDYLELLEEITLEDIKNRFEEHIDIDNMVLSVVSPLEGK